MATAVMTREEWLAERKTGIGASEAAAVAGCSPWSTPLGVYFDKTGQVPNEEREPTPWQKWGLKLEDQVANDYREESGVPIEKAPQLMRYADWPVMLASCDYWVPGERVSDIKCVFNNRSQQFGEEGTDEIPPHYALQLQQQMAVAEVDQADLVCLFLGAWKVKVYHVARKQDVIDNLLQIEQDFWQRVLNHDPPLPDFEHPTTLELLNSLDPEGEITLLGDDALQLANQYEALGEFLSGSKKQRDAVKAKLIALMGDAPQGDLPDGRTITRKKIHRKAHSVKASEFYDFRIKKAK